MIDPTAFITHGLAETQRALGPVADRLQAHLNPVTLARTLAQRARAELARLEVILRRLLTLMALGLTLDPVKPRAATPAKPQLDQAEPILRKSVPGVSLTASVLPALDPDASGLFPDSVRATGPVPAAPLLARLAALQQVLADPEAHAKRLARALDRQKKRGEARPMALPMPRTHRMPTELGAVATALPGMLRNAFDTWESSG